MPYASPIVHCLPPRLGAAPGLFRGYARLLRRRDAILMLLALGCTDVKPAPQPAVRAALKPLATPATSSHPSAVMCPTEYADEAVALQCANGAAYRHGDTLFVRLADEHVLTHLNAEGREASTYYTYEGQLRGSGGGARTFHLIHLSGGDDWGKLRVIDAASGDSMTLTMTPLMSPDSTRFLLSDTDVDICIDSSSFSVWRVTTGKPEREWVSHASCNTARYWSVTRPEWRSADTIALTRLVPSDTGRREEIEKPARLIRRATGWSFESYP
jgi:hypothetical protein